MQNNLTVPLSKEQSATGRTRRLLQGAFSTTLSKTLVLVVNALSIPITIRYLGAESFGVWTTISTLLSMLLILDLGVANSLTNFLSKAYASNHQEDASTYTTTAMAIMILFSLFLAVVGWGIWPYLHWDAIFHLTGKTINSTVVGHAVAAALAVFLFGLPAALAPRILGGYQELRLASIFQAVGGVLSLVSLIVLIQMHAGLVALVAASSASMVLANLLCLIWLWSRHKPWLAPRAAHLNRAAARRMLQSGSEFFVLQIAALVVFNSDNLIVTHYLGPAQVASYSVAWRLVGYAAVVQTLIAPALWPAFSEAFARDDMEWIRLTFVQTMRLTMGAAFAFSIVFAFAGRQIIELWASSRAVPSQGLMLLMCVWTVISTFMNNTSIILVSKGDTRLQAWCSLAAAGLNIALSIYWVQRIGASGVILGTIVSYLAILVVPQTWKVYQILKIETNDSLSAHSLEQQR